MAGLSVPIQKNLDSYHEKIVGNMTARTLTALALGVVCEVALGIFVYFVLGIPVEALSFLFFLAAVPFFLFGFWSHKGNPWMTAERFFPLWIRFNFGDTVSVRKSSFGASGVTGRLELEEEVDRGFRKRAAETRGRACAERRLARFEGGRPGEQGRA